MQGKERERLTKVGSLAAKKLGFQQAAYLDSGSNGIALKVSDDKILKVTTDATEYVEASKLKGKATKHLADIYSIWALKNPEYKDVYIIVKQAVDVGNKATKQVSNAIDSLERVWQNSDVVHIALEETATNFFHHYYRSGSYSKKQIDEMVDILQADDTNAAWCFEQIIGLLDEMRHFGITSDDYWNNLGMKNGNIVYYDIGYGKPMDVDMHYMELNEIRAFVRSLIYRAFAQDTNV